MFHRIIFLLLIVSTVSCNFNRCGDCFQSFSEQRSERFPEYSKCRALNRFKIKNKHNKEFIMLERNSVNVHSNTRHCQHRKSQNRLAVQMILKIFSRFTAKAHTCFDRPEQQFVSQYCEILHSVVRGLYDKNSASQYCFTSDVMYK